MFCFRLCFSKIFVSDFAIQKFLKILVICKLFKVAFKSKVKQLVSSLFLQNNIRFCYSKILKILLNQAFQSGRSIVKSNNWFPGMVFVVLYLYCICYNRFPTTYWITNPQTYVRDNVAAGSEVKTFIPAI